MNDLYGFAPNSWLLTLIMIIVIWEVVWKLIALWTSARNNHLAWFICIAIFATAGMLPIIYILLHRHKQRSHHTATITCP